MARLARADVFCAAEVSAWHCINRCVRRCFLCGADATSGKNYDHRKRWLEQRFQFLAAFFGVDVLGFAVLSNHFHLVLRNRPDVVATWTDAEVARRWLWLCPYRKNDDGRPAEPLEREIAALANNLARVAELRQRLSDISWFMRMVAEPVARRANREDETNGRFWQGRFRATKLCDEAALLACAIYVDLNPIRAGLADTPEQSDFTSAQRRIESLAPVEPPPTTPVFTSPPTARPASVTTTTTTHTLVSPTSPAPLPPDAWLAPLSLSIAADAMTGPAPSITGQRCSDKGFLSLSSSEYLALLDWTGRQIIDGKSGAIPPDLAPILLRVGLDTSRWLHLATEFGHLFARVAGACPALERHRNLRTGRPFRCRHAHLLGTD